MIDASSSTLGFFASEVVRLRKAQGLSQPALAKLLSYSPSQVAKIETGERVPKRPLALKLDEAFGTDGHFARLQALVENTSVLPWFRDLYLVEGEASSRVLVRDTQDRSGPVLQFTPGAWRRFADRLKAHRPLGGCARERDPASWLAVTSSAGRVRLYLLR